MSDCTCQTSSHKIPHTTHNLSSRVFARIEKLLREISSLDFMQFVQLSYATAGCCLDSLLRARQVLTLLGIPFSKLGKGIGTGIGVGIGSFGVNSSFMSSRMSEDDNHKMKRGEGSDIRRKKGIDGVNSNSTSEKGNCLDSRNLTPNGIQSLLSFNIVSQIKNLLIGWVRIRMGESDVMTGRKEVKCGRRFKVTGPLSANNIWKADIPSSASSASLSETLLLFHRLDVSLIELGEKGSPSGSLPLGPHSLGAAEIYRNLGVLNTTQKKAQPRTSVPALNSAYIHVRTPAPPPSSVHLHLHYPHYASSRSQILSGKQQLLRSEREGEIKEERDREGVQEREREEYGGVGGGKENDIGVESYLTISEAASRQSDSLRKSYLRNDRDENDYDNKYSNENNHDEIEAPRGSLSSLPRQIALEISVTYQGTTSSYHSNPPSYHSNPPSYRSHPPSFNQASTSTATSTSTASNRKNTPRLQEAEEAKEIQNFMAHWVRDPRSVREALRLSYLILELARHLVIARSMVSMTNQSTVALDHPLDLFQNELKKARELGRKVKSISDLRNMNFKTYSTDLDSGGLIEEGLEEMKNNNYKKGLGGRLGHREGRNQSQFSNQDNSPQRDHRGSTPIAWNLGEGSGQSRGQGKGQDQGGGQSRGHGGGRDQGRGQGQGMGHGLSFSVNEGANARLCLADTLTGDELHNFLITGTDSSTRFARMKNGFVQGIALLLMTVGEVTAAECVCRQSRGPRSASQSHSHSQQLHQSVPYSRNIMNNNSDVLSYQGASVTCVGNPRDDIKEKKECGEILRILHNLRICDFTDISNDDDKDEREVKRGNMMRRNENSKTEIYLRQLDILCDHLFGPFSTYIDKNPKDPGPGMVSDEEMGFEEEKSNSQTKGVDFEPLIPTPFRRGIFSDGEQFSGIFGRGASTSNRKLNVCEELR